MHLALDMKIVLHFSFSFLRCCFLHNCFCSLCWSFLSLSLLLGCIRAGIIAAPVQPPDPNRLAHDVARMNAIANACSARAILCNNEYNRIRQLSKLRQVCDKAATKKRKKEKENVILRKKCAFLVVSPWLSELAQFALACH